MLRLGLSILVTLLMGATSAFSHEGEDHGAKAAGPAPLVATTSQAASSARHELVVTAPNLAPLAEARLELYLNEWATNAPTEGAVVALEFRPRTGGAAAAKAVAEATSQPGVYAATMRMPAAGAYNLLVSLQSSLGADEFALSGFVVTATRAGGAHRAISPFLWIALAALLAVAAILAIARLRAGRKAVAMLVLLSAFAARVNAHEGHDHAPTEVTTAGAEVELSKASQFLLGIRTELAAPSPVARQIQLIGRVAPRGGAEVEIVAPQAGRVYFRSSVGPTLGTRVSRGSLLATLVVVDSLALRAPLSAQVSAVHAVNGQRVEAGQKLISLLDPSTVWVHADAFGQDLGALEHASRAVVTSDGYPGVEFPARRLALGASTGDVPGAVEVWFQVPNPANRLLVGLPVQVSVPVGSEESLVLLPRDAVLDRDGGTRVFVHTGPERFVMRAVTVVTRAGDRVAVRGLKAGERVVTRGANGLLGASPVVGK